MQIYKSSTPSAWGKNPFDFLVKEVWHLLLMNDTNGEIYLVN